MSNYGFMYRTFPHGPQLGFQGMESGCRVLITSIHVAEKYEPVQTSNIVHGQIAANEMVLRAYEEAKKSYLANDRKLVH